MATDLFSNDSLCLSILDEFDDGILIADETGRIIEANRAVCSLYGYTRHQLCQMHFDDLVARTVSVMPSSRTRPKPGVGVEQWHCDSNNQLIYVDIFSRNLRQSPQNSLLTVIRIRNISFSHRQEQQKLRDDQIYKAVVESGPSLIARALPDSTLTFANQAYCRYFGQNRQEIIGRNLIDLAQDESSKSAVRQFFDSYTKNPRVSIHDNLVHKGNSESRWLQFTESPIFDENGVLQEIQIIAVDIHEQKIAKIALEQNEAKYRAMLEQSNEGIALIDLETNKLLEVNQKLCDMLGYSAKELLSLPPMRLSMLTDDLYRALIDELNQNSALPPTLTRFTAKFGNIIEVERVAKRLALEGKNLALVSIRDLSEKRKIELTLRKQTEELKSRIDQLQKSWSQTIDVLAAASEAKDPYTAGHQNRVARLAVAIGEKLNLSADQLTGLRMAALIHDIGKIKLPTDILSKPGKLLTLEYQLVQIHVSAGFELLHGLDLPWDVADVVLQHHERMNGSGYPQGIQGEEILFKARILCVADVVEAMSSHRPYRPSLGVEKALDEVEKEKGRLYDPEVSDACLSLFRQDRFSFV